MMLFLEDKTLLQCILEKLPVIHKKTCNNSTLYWGEGEAENQKVMKFGEVFQLLFFSSSAFMEPTYTCMKFFSPFILTF